MNGQGRVPKRGTLHADEARCASSRRSCVSAYDCWNEISQSRNIIASAVAHVKTIRDGICIYMPDGEFNAPLPSLTCRLCCL